MRLVKFSAFTSIAGSNVRLIDFLIFSFCCRSKMSLTIFTFKPKSKFLSVNGGFFGGFRNFYLLGGFMYV